MDGLPTVTFLRIPVRQKARRTPRTSSECRVHASGDTERTRVALITPLLLHNRPSCAAGVWSDGGPAVVASVALSDLRRSQIITTDPPQPRPTRITSRIEVRHCPAVSDARPRGTGRKHGETSVQRETVTTAAPPVGRINVRLRKFNTSPRESGSLLCPTIRRGGNYSPV